MDDEVKRQDMRREEGEVVTAYETIRGGMYASFLRLAVSNKRIEKRKGHSIQRWIRSLVQDAGIRPTYDVDGDAKAIMNFRFAGFSDEPALAFF